MTDAFSKDGYSRLSIVIHWMTAIIVISLFVTHEAASGSVGRFIHDSIGAAAGLFLLWRVWHRVTQGTTNKPDQALIYNIASQIVILGFLVSLVLVVITGYFLPWSLGAPVDFLGMIDIPSPIDGYLGLHQVVEKIHDIAGTLFLPLLGLHLIGAAKHAFVDKDGIAQRMFKSITGGR
ncbi:MAG: cytochrome b/b6 domain-containing protein [Halopseudomonas aestusnigri]